MIRYSDEDSEMVEEDRGLYTGGGSEHSRLFILSLVKKTSRVSPTREEKTSDRLFFSKVVLIESFIKIKPKSEQPIDLH